MIRDLEKADLQGRLDRRWKVYMRPSILIVDEVGYYSMDRRAAELFFQIVCRRYETGSIILTSNKHFSEWGDRDRNGYVGLSSASCPYRQHQGEELQDEGPVPRWRI
jgi:DNA replication protein DnaC